MIAHNTRKLALVSDLAARLAYYDRCRLPSAPRRPRNTLSPRPSLTAADRRQRSPTERERQVAARYEVARLALARAEAALVECSSIALEEGTRDDGQLWRSTMQARVLIEDSRALMRHAPAVSPSPESPTP